MSNYKDLTVWKKSMELTEEVYRLSFKLPKEESYGLASQIRRAVISIPSNIAEGKGRESDNELLHFLSIAAGSCHEVETQLIIGERLKYWDNEDIQKALSLCSEVMMMLMRFKRRIKTD